MQPQTIIELLRADDDSARVSVGRRWLVWIGDRWWVFERGYKKQLNTTLYSGPDEAQAVAALIGEVRP